MGHYSCISSMRKTFCFLFLLAVTFFTCTIQVDPPCPTPGSCVAVVDVYPCIEIVLPDGGKAVQCENDAGKDSGKDAADAAHE